MLREQVITPRAGRGGGQGSRDRTGEIAQRPVKRGGGSGGGQGAAGRKASKDGAWRMALAWMPLMGKTLLAVCAGVIIFTTYRTAASSSFFALRTIDVSGVSQASDDQLKALVRRAVSSSGVWKADLKAVGAELERQPWVRTAVVSRVLPSGVRVRITERVPRAVVRTAAGRFVWVDDDGVMTGTVAPTQNAPAFFMRGWDESGTESGRAENRRRVEKYLALSHEWEAAGVASRVSEVNLDDVRDVRAQLTGDDSRIEVRLGRDDLTKRLRQAVDALDVQRNTPRGAFITYIDMTQGKRAVIGFKSQALSLNSEDSSTNGNTKEVVSRAATTPNVAADTNQRPAEAKQATADAAETARPSVEKQSKSKESKESRKPAVARESQPATGATRGSAERPRRVGRSG